jgi:hypothetical protein
MAEGIEGFPYLMAAKTGTPGPRASESLRLTSSEVTRSGEPPAVHIFE